jgi:hypothetical protein
MVFYSCNRFQSLVAGYMLLEHRCLECVLSHWYFSVFFSTSYAYFVGDSAAQTGLTRILLQSIPTVHAISSWETPTPTLESY